MITEQFKINVMDYIQNSPLPLLAIENEETVRYINTLLPYSIGIELECNNKPEYNRDSFSLIPNLMAINNDSSEKRFRIPHGVYGLLALHNILNQMKLNCYEAFDSGIHYHIDFTDVFTHIKQSFIDVHKEWILEELDKWGTADPLRSRNVKLDDRCWVQFQSSFKTMEIRIGELSFDYTTIINRILDCNRIAKYLKSKIIGEDKVYEDIESNYYKFDPVPIITYLDMNPDTHILLQQLAKREQILKDEQDSLFKSERPKEIDVEALILSRRVKRF